MNVRPELVLKVLVGMLTATVVGLIVSAPGPSMKVIETPAPAYLPGIQTEWEQRAADMGVTVIFTDDERNCGAIGRKDDQVGGGCASLEQPIIYVGLGLDARGVEFTALHELAHILQMRQGVALDECQADDIARHWGGIGLGYGCYGPETGPSATLTP
jgi:hypothetical protein